MAHASPTADPKSQKMFEFNNQKWKKLHAGKNILYDEPIIHGLDVNHFFQTSQNTDWLLGITGLQKHHISLLKSPAKKLCERARTSLALGFTGPAYQLLTSTLGLDLETENALEALYAGKTGDYLQIASKGDWWVGLFREGILIKSSIKANQDKEYYETFKITHATTWLVNHNDIMVITPGKFGVNNVDTISMALETGEKLGVPLSQMAANIEANLWRQELSKSDILVIRRMEDSGDWF